MIIDNHVHVWDEGYQPLGYKQGMARSAAYRRYPFRDPATILPRVMQAASDPSGELLLKEMSVAGVDAVFAMTVDMGLAYGQEQDTPIERVLELHAELTKKYEGHFYAYFGMDPRRQGALDLFKRSVREWKFKGLKLYCPCGYYPLSDETRPFLRAALDMDVPVLYHTGTVAPPLRPGYVHPIYMSEVAVEFPDLNIIYGHIGRPYWWRDVLHVARNHPSSYLELSQWNEDALHSPATFVPKLAEMRDVVGAHRILFGSDFAAGPNTVGDRGSYPKWVRFMQELPETAGQYGCTFSREEVDLIMGGNAARINNLS